MLRRLSAKEHIASLLNEWEATIRDAFLEAVAAIVSTVVLARLVEAIKSGDPQRVIAELRIDRAAFAKFRTALADAYNAGGEEAVRLFGASARFDNHDAAAVAEIAAHSQMLVDRIVDDMNAGIAQQTITWIAAGLTANTIAQSLVGRRSSANRIRVGGLIGLTAQQMQFAETAAAELRSGDPHQVASYLRRKPRVRRFDKQIAAAAEKGRPVPSAEVSRLIGLYCKNMGQLRGKLIGQTQSLTALNMGIETAIRLQLRREQISPLRLTKTWHSQRDERVRHTHQGLEGNQIAFDHRFLSDSGATLRFPGDPEAPPHEIIGCRCYLSFSLERD